MGFWGTCGCRVGGCLASQSQDMCMWSGLGAEVSASSPQSVWCGVCRMLSVHVWDAKTLPEVKQSEKHRGIIMSQNGAANLARQPQIRSVAHVSSWEYVFPIIQMNLWVPQTVQWLRTTYFYSKVSHLLEPPRRTPCSPSWRQDIHQRRKISSNLSLHHFPLIWTICLHFLWWKQRRKWEKTGIKLWGEKIKITKTERFIHLPWSIHTRFKCRSSYSVLTLRMLRHLIQDPIIGNFSISHISVSALNWVSSSLKTEVSLLNRGKSDLWQLVAWGVLQGLVFGFCSFFISYLCQELFSFSVSSFTPAPTMKKNCSNKSLKEQTFNKIHVFDD